MLALANRVADWLGARSDRAWAVLIAVIGLAVYVPHLGSFPLWDPWEPHYTQVAWEMQERHTWWNPWYRGLDNWWSKPPLMLWMLRASLALFWDPAVDFANNEWAARLPFALTAVLGGVLHFDWVRRLYGRKVGVVAAIILLTAPQYLLVGRQVMADVPFIVAYAASLGYLAVGLFTPRAEIDRPRGSRAWLSLWLKRDWPFIAFWSLQALAVLAKGFVAPVLAALVLAAYGVATLRWSDYARAWFAPATHAWALLRRIRAGWGLVLFFAIGAPWFVAMTIEHGWPFWNEFIFYHHVGRAAGTIDKPGGTFDVYVRHLGFALFPWSAFVAGALWKFAAAASYERSVAERRNLFILLATVMPYLVFALSGTKFAHYILPVVPLLGVMLAATLIWLGKDEERVALAEGPLASAVPAYGDAPSSWWRQAGSRGDLVVFTALALVLFGVLAHDLVLDFRLFLRLVAYYYNRATPFDYQPFATLQVIFFPIGIVMGLLLFARYVSRWHLAGIAAGALVLACYVGWETMPAMQLTYSYKPFYFAYQQLAKPDEPIGQFNDWQQPERSVIFLFQNRAHHLRSDAQATAFLKRSGRKFVLVDRDRLADIRRVAKEAGVPLFVVFDGHPYARLLSDVTSPEQVARAGSYLVRELPTDAEAADADFAGQIRLIGWSVNPAEVSPGASTTVSLYFQCRKLMSRDWQIFVHGDSAQGASHRIHLDHFPVEGLYPTPEWQEGEIIRDTFAVNVPANYPFNDMDLWVGFYSGQERMPLANNPPNDGHNRVRGPHVRVARE